MSFDPLKLASSLLGSLGALGAVAGAAAAAYLAGAHAQSLDDSVSNLKAAVASQAKAEQAEQTAQSISDRVGAALEAKGAARTATTTTILKRIPTYVHDPALAAAGGPPALTLPVGFVRVHDAAATGDLSALPAAPGGADDAPSGVGLPRLAEVVTENYGECRALADQVRGWQSWWTQQSAAAGR